MKINKTQSESILNILGVDISEKVINWDLMVELNKAFKEKKIRSYISFDGDLKDAVISVQITIDKYLEVEKERKEKERKEKERLEKEKEKERLKKERELEKNRLDEVAKLEKEKIRTTCKYTDPKKQEIERWLFDNNPNITCNHYHIYDDYSVDIYTHFRITKKSGLPYKLNSVVRLTVEISLNSVENLPIVFTSPFLYEIYYEWCSDTIKNDEIEFKLIDSNRYEKPNFNYNRNEGYTVEDHYIKEIKKFEGSELLIERYNSLKKYVIFEFIEKENKYALRGIAVSMATINKILITNPEIKIEWEEDFGFYTQENICNSKEGKMIGVDNEPPRLQNWKGRMWSVEDFKKRSLETMKIEKIKEIKASIINKLTPDEIKWLNIEI